MTRATLFLGLVHAGVQHRLSASLLQIGTSVHERFASEGRGLRPEYLALMEDRLRDGMVFYFRGAEAIRITGPNGIEIRAADSQWTWLTAALLSALVVVMALAPWHRPVRSRDWAAAALALAVGVVSVCAALRSAALYHEISVGAHC